MADDPGDALLSVAREIIAKRGYLGLSMRTASAAAGVTPEVARRYYRNRDALFAAALRLPVDPTTAIPTLVAPGLEGMGERLVRFTLDILKDPEARSELVSLARTGVNAGHAAAGLQDFLEKGVVDRVATMIGVPDARMRSALITSYLLGIAMTRYAVRLEPLSSASEEEIIRMVAPVIQDLLDPRKPLPGSSRARGTTAQTKATDGSATRAKSASGTPSPPTRSFQADPSASAQRPAAASTSARPAASSTPPGSRARRDSPTPATPRPAAGGPAHPAAPPTAPRSRAAAPGTRPAGTRPEAAAAAKAPGSAGSRTPGAGSTKAARSAGAKAAGATGAAPAAGTPAAGTTSADASAPDTGRRPASARPRPPASSDPDDQNDHA